ncbi:MAG: S9 family peptidase [Candidatus Palauibacterales bacterium]|nr:S9 family peptidase [Candidatus Palauibacterales bacterium]MDP2528463.1 S9 family peptidase [Candidatus Palauibacterales bacterium]MDP2582986.1 S9 family peptidase [Candidatus Palauibacterales bacterium]
MTSRPARTLAALCVAAALVLPPRARAQEVAGAPSFRQVLGLRSVGGVAIAPDGSAVAYEVRGADWDANRYDTEIWLVRPGAAPFQLTRTAKGSSTSPSWSPDGKWLAFLSSRDEGKTQVWLIRPDGGEARPLTDVAEGARSFAWSPDGASLAVSIQEPQSAAMKARKKDYGEWRVESENAPPVHLWVMDLSKALATGDGAKLPADSAGSGTSSAPADGSGSAFRALTPGAPYTVVGFRWSPDGSRIAFSHQPDGRVPSFTHRDLSVVDVATDSIRTLVDGPGPDAGPVWSPDGRWIAFSTGAGDTAYYATDEIAKVRASGGKPELLTGAYDANADPVAWLPDGLIVQGWRQGQTVLYKMDADSKKMTELTDTPRAFRSVDYTRDARFAAFVGATPTEMSEVYLTSASDWRPRKLTDMTAQVAGWPIGTERDITWKSKDGAVVHGVLITPPGFDSTRRHPLVVRIHGGPTGIDLPILSSQVESYVYPLTQWLARGAVVLMPNYRGSLGYGQAFEKLNVGNLGVGDAWDVMSGVQGLIDRGIADPDSMVAMGWSEGGYISAFLTTTTHRFKAISVGAGISDWMTYYVNTDIHPFTISYLGGTPWDLPKVYARTSPITYIKQASTPTLIQHDDGDPRVPPPNGFELYQGLRDVGVPVKFVLYHADSHGVPTPKQRLAATWHNWAWVAKWMYGEDVKLPFPEGG